MKGLDVRVERDSDGLPVVWFNGFNGFLDLLDQGKELEKPQRCCKLYFDEKWNAWQFACWAQGYANRRAFWTMVAIVSMMISVVLAIPIAIAILGNIERWTAVLVAIGIGLFDYALLRLSVKSYGMARGGDWQELDSFVLSSDNPGLSLYAYFRNEGAPIEILSTSGGVVPHGEYAVLRHALEREFIHGRSEIMERLAARERKRASSVTALSGSGTNKAGAEGFVLADDMTLGGRCPPADVQERDPENDDADPMDADGRYVIQMSDADDVTGVGALTPFRDRRGNVVQHFVIYVFDFPHRKDVPDFFVYGANVPKGMGMPLDFWASIPLDYLEALEIMAAADWKDARFKEFVFGADEHVILARVKGREQRELVARSGLAGRDDLERLKAACEGQIARARANPRRRVKVI